MFKPTILLMVTWAAAVAIIDSASSLEERTPTAPVVQYNGPLYTLTADEKASLEKAQADGTEWTRPAGMPVIDLPGNGTVLDLGGAGGEMVKRSGNHQINVYNEVSGCTTGFVFGLAGFGCGSGCINVSPCIAALLFEDAEGNPSPTASLFSSPGCGGISTSVGISKGLSRACTGTSFNFQSFMAFWNC